MKFATNRCTKNVFIWQLMFVCFDTTYFKWHFEICEDIYQLLFFITLCFDQNTAGHFIFRDYLCIRNQTFTKYRIVVCGVTSSDWMKVLLERDLPFFSFWVNEPNDKVGNNPPVTANTSVASKWVWRLLEMLWVLRKPL